VPGLHILAAAREAGVAPLDLVWFTSGRSVEDRVLATLAERAGDVPWERVVLPIEPPGGGAPSRLRWPRNCLRATSPRCVRCDVTVLKC